MRRPLLTSLPVIAVLTAALVAAPWPDGDVMGRDREIVARLTRGGVQRLDADVDHGVHDAADHAVAAVPLAHLPGAGLAAATWTADGSAVIPARWAPPLPPGVRFDPERLAAAWRPAPPGRRSSDRAPPAA